MGQKRQRDPKGSTAPVNKKKKGADSDNATDKNAWDGIVAVDDLNWKEVPLPDRLEDASGFFGLEEIDGVDVLRTEGQGDIRFKAKTGKNKDSVVRKESAEETEFDEWSGFSDDASGKQAPANETREEPEEDSEVKDGQKSKKQVKKEALEAKKKAKREAQKEAKKEQKEKEKEKDSKNQQGQNIKPGLSFEALQGEEEDDGVDVSAWETLGLSPELLTGISKMKFTTPTSVQQTCIPQILNGHDVVGKASTGSGKTLAFGIPILEHYLERTRTEQKKKSDKNDPCPIALILSPTRELAHQLAKHIGELASLSPASDARIALLTGGLSLHKQQRLLTGADIVIGTPGRMWEILSTGQGLIQKMQKIKFLVVDEADRLLTQGNYKELEQVLDSLDRVETFDIPEVEDSGEADAEETNPMAQRQTLVFSATFHRDLQQKLSGKGQWKGGDIMDKKESMEYLLQKLQFREEKPKFIDMNPVSQMAENLKEGIVECGPMEKDLYLYALLLYHPKRRTLVFTNSISAVRRTTQFLQALQLPALALHSSMAQKARLRSVERFSSPTSDPSSILVATDVAARGLDIKGIDFVLHYHAPRTADAYVHRSGRTARAGAAGKSVIICGPEEMAGVVRLAAKVHSNRSQKGQQTKRVPLESVELDRRVISRVKPRITLATRITDSHIAKEKVSAEDNWLRNAADDLGVDYDSEEFDSGRAKGRGRGGGRHQRDKDTGSVSKAEVAGMRAELKHLLSQRVNVGVSEKYLTAGRVDIDALLRGEGNDSFLGQVDPLGF